LTRREGWIAELVAVSTEELFGDVWVLFEESILHLAVGDEILVLVEELQEPIPDRQLCS